MPFVVSVEAQPSLALYYNAQRFKSRLCPLFPFCAVSSSRSHLANAVGRPECPYAHGPAELAAVRIYRRELHIKSITTDPQLAKVRACLPLTD